MTLKHNPLNIRVDLGKLRQLSEMLLPLAIRDMFSFSVLSLWNFMIPGLENALALYFLLFVVIKQHAVFAMEC